MVLAACGTLSALGELPSWVRNVESASAIEAAFFRMMALPSGDVAFRRPPSETRPALSDLIKVQPQNAELYSLRALEDEQQLDFSTAESDWKSYAGKASNKIDAQLALADFYHRRLRPSDEIKALSIIANSPVTSAERLMPPSQQRSWQAFARIFGIIEDQGLPKEISIKQYQAWIARYPAESSLYARFIEFLVAQKEYALAGEIIASYQKQFPCDQVFPVKANAMLQYHQGSVQVGLSVYEHSFQPLWDPELVKSYFDLLRETQSLRRFLDQERAALTANPSDLNAMARIFYYYQQQGKLDAAAQAIADFRAHKESSNSPWMPNELYVCARLLEDIHFYPESARYYFALYNSKGSMDAQEQAIAGLTDILLTAPETPIRFGSGELSMYRDIATMDQGPGYLNGILSLILNTTDPAMHYSEEESRAIPYFHRAQAAQMLALLDTKFPSSTRRPGLYAKLLQYYADAGESDALIHGGKEFLVDFPTASQRTSVALLMADAYARKNDTASEFAIYDSALRELAAHAQNVPLGESAVSFDNEYREIETYAQSSQESESDDEDQSANLSNANPVRARQQAFQIAQGTTSEDSSGPRSPEYARVLERYLARMVETKQIPHALSVLSGEIERNPNDPGLYERLAVFLDQNHLGEEQEEVYKHAIAQFSDHSWYDKLARFYLSHKRDEEFEALSLEAIKSFNGTDLERYFENIYGSPALYLRLNQYAHQRFPHNPIFVDNLLRAYHTTQTYNEQAWEALIRQHWFEEAGLRNQFFEFLSRTGQLEGELNALRKSAPDENAWSHNPAAADFIANAELWQSHFEESAPELKSLAAQYPADHEIAEEASSIYRSLAYFDSSATTTAAKIEDNLVQANPRDTELLARIGDIYADKEQFTQAAPYWERIPQVSPGKQSNYLEAATIYWDYFDFDRALRLLGEGRARLGNPNLYSYEAGAIYENKRDYPHAIEQYVNGALANNDSSAESRLLQLARRPRFRDLVEKSTAKIADNKGNSMAPIYLRVKVLEAQGRKQELESFLDAAANNTTSIEQAEDIETLAQQKSLETVRQHALEKQIALTIDPVTRLQLRFSLIQLYEAHKDFTSAERNVEALYRENPKILGVVRFTVDFYWRTKNQSQAISVLLQAAKDAYPDLSKQFMYEAVRKSTDAKNYQQAEDLLTKLLAPDPYNSEYLAAMADAYASTGDDQALHKFYTDEIALFRQSSLPPDTKKAQIGALRRGLIPALTRMKDYAGAIDQYIELINSFPEDEVLVTEAALYAQRYDRKPQLLNFYSKTVAESPRDYRWGMVLARIQTNLEDYSSAIATYGKAITIRPDRSDLFTARAELENRLMRFDSAVSDYERIYQLNYKDPQWMEKIAEIRARQGKSAETVTALKIALIDGRPENPSNYFDAAHQLESWGMLNEARSFAEQGVKTAGANLLADSEYLDGAKTYVRIMTRLRQYEQACNTMQHALAGASSEVSILEAQVGKQGITGLTDQKWRDRVHEERIETARSGMTAVLKEMGETVNTYFTSEERVTFAAFAGSKRKDLVIEDVERFAIPLAQSASLSDEEAQWRFEVLMAQPYKNIFSEMHALIDLQQRRGKFAELGNQMEQLAQASPSRASVQFAPQLAAADAYRSAGDISSELRILDFLMRQFGSLDEPHQQRIFELLLARQPDELVRISSLWTPVGQKAADFVIANSSAQLSHQVVDARSQNRMPVWNGSYNALVGLYFKERTADVNQAFVSVLGNQTIGENLSKKPDRSQRLAGNIWFYYGSRYGQYLGVTQQGNPEDFLPALLEESPATASSYKSLADYYAEAGETQRAITDYQHTLELDTSRPDVHDDLALTYYKQGDRTKAQVEWKQAFAEMLKQVNASRVPENFWHDFGQTCDQLRTRHLFDALKPDAESVLQSYLRHNGNWRSNALLQPAYFAAGDPVAATSWLIELSSYATDPTQVLADVVDASWMPLSQRAAIYQRILQIKRDNLAKLVGMERDSAQQDLGFWQVRWIAYLVRTKQYSDAAQAITSLPEEVRTVQAQMLVPLNLKIAAQLGTLDAEIATYRNAPQDAPTANLLRDGAQQLYKDGDTVSARKILEFVFAREIDDHQLIASNFLGLAEIRLASGDTVGALDLLRRLVSVVGNPFENLDPAAALLERTGHYAEATEFLEQLVKSTPWNASYQLRLARAQIAAGKDVASAINSLAAIASATSNSYDLRTQAALALAGQSHTDFGSAELNLLARNAAISATQADKPYFYQARIKAAQAEADQQMKRQILSHALSDFPSREEARIALFKSAESVHFNEFALGIIQPLLQNQFLRQYPQGDNEDESENNERDETTNVPAVFSSRLSRFEQAQLAELIGDTMLQLNRPSEALHYFQVAHRLNKTKPHKNLDQKISNVQAMLRIQNENAKRQPIFHEALDQDRTVRPRLIAHSGHSADMQGGEQQ